jgi:hypothetical protein
MTLGSHGRGKLTVPGFALEIELVLPSQHAVRLVHGIRTYEVAVGRTSVELPSLRAGDTDLARLEAGK